MAGRLSRVGSLGARLATAALLIVPPGALTPAPAGMRYVEGLRPALSYLRRSTPDPGGLFDPTQRPAWAVLSDWSLGHLIVTLGERPVLASPLGQTPPAEEADLKVRAIFAMTDPPAAARLCRQSDLRYALVYAPLPLPTGPPRTLKGMLLRGAPAKGFKEVFVDQQSDRIARVYQIVEPD
jgi:hypothetical protein